VRRFTEFGESKQDKTFAHPLYLTKMEVDRQIRMIADFVELESRCGAVFFFHAQPVREGPLLTHTHSHTTSHLFTRPAGRRQLRSVQ